MPRVARLDTLCLLHHIMIRGIERRKIFDDDKNRGIDFDKIVERVCNLFNLEKDYITGKGRQKNRVRDVVCYWAVIELGEPMIGVARRFDITPSAIGYAVQRGEKIVKKGDLRLID